MGHQHYLCRNTINQEDDDPRADSALDCCIMTTDCELGRRLLRRHCPAAHGKFKPFVIRRRRSRFGQTR
jgi:hypothetical protein